MHRIVLFCGFLRASCFFLVFFVHQIVLFLSFLRAPNRAFLWFSSCTKSCFFCGFLRAPNGAPVHAFLFDDFASYTKSCSSSSSFVVFFVHQIVLFSGFLRAPSRAFFWFSSCTKSCFFCAFFLHQTVLFFTFLRAPNRAFFWFSSCTKSCFFAVCFVHQMVPYFVPLLQRLGKTQYIYIKLYKYMSCCQNSLSSLSSREKGIAFGGALSLSAVL